MLAAAIVGPSRGLVVMAVVLAVPALLFQDGGVTAFGANLMGSSPQSDWHSRVWRAGTALAGVVGTLVAAALAWALSRGLGAPPEARPHR